MTVMLTSMGTAIRPLRVTTIAVSTRHHSPSATRRGDHDHRAMACGDVGPVRPCQATAAIRTAPNRATVTTGTVTRAPAEAARTDRYRSRRPATWPRAAARTCLASVRRHGWGQECERGRGCDPREVGTRPV